MMHAPASSAAWTSYSTITIKTQKQGDVNGDNTIDVADIATVIDVMAGSADVSSASADVNGDGTVDVADIAAIIDTMAANARRQRDIIQIGFR
ncbi:MAG: dockerin type I repeat-containing protein [Prevotella sp.]|nr:dockerin type I repeat-containing protein [Prevotella sp.]